METPPVRILQRPCPIVVDNPTENAKPTVVKTLEQREADYAAARRRIMGSDEPEPEEGEQASTTSGTKSMATDTPIGNSAPRRSSVTNIVTTATPLMSIQATPTAVGFKSDFRVTGGTTSCLLLGNGGQARTAAYNSRHGSNTCVPKPQQQLPSVLSGTRSAPQQQLHPILTASSSSPALFLPSRPTQHMPMYPTHMNTPNIGILPNPPGFSYSSNSIDGGVGLHHSQTAAAPLMQHFGLLQQQYQPPVNHGFQNVMSQFAHSNNSTNLLNYGMSSLFGTNHQHTHQSTFN